MGVLTEVARKVGITGIGRAGVSERVFFLESPLGCVFVIPFVQLHRLVICYLKTL